MCKLVHFNKLYFSISVTSFEIEMESYLETNSTLNTWAVGYVGDMYRSVVTGISREPRLNIWQFGGSDFSSDCDNFDNKTLEVFEVACYYEFYINTGYNIKFIPPKWVSIFNLKRELTLEDDKTVIQVESQYDGETKKLNVTIGVKGSFYLFNKWLVFRCFF